MEPLTDQEIDRGIARRFVNGEWRAYEICGDCHESFEQEDRKLGYGYSDDGRGRCRSCLDKSGAFKNSPNRPSLREMVLAKLSVRGSSPEALAKLVGHPTVEVRQELLRLIEEGRVWSKGKLYGKIVSAKSDEE
jgi:hypothetical protein